MQEDGLKRRHQVVRGLLVWGVYALPLLAVLGLTGLPSRAVSLVTVGAALLGGGLWYRVAGDVGPRNTLRLVLLMWVLGLLLLASYTSLTLPDDVRFVYAVWVGLSFGGVVASDVRFVQRSRQERSVRRAVAAVSLGSLFAFGSWWTVASVVAGGDSLAFLLFALVALAAWRVLGRIPDPVRAQDPLRRFTPWSGGDGLPRREGWRRLVAAPVTVGYLVVSWALFLPFARVQSGLLQLPRGLTERFAFAIPDLTRDPLGALTTLVTAPLVNHDIIQLVYVTLLLLVVGIPFEAREGSRRFLVVFVGVGAAGALIAGVLLHLVYPDVSGHPVLATAWERTWSGGSAGAFALMGAVAARAPTPWPLVAFFVFWEVNVGWWYLRSYTPAFHLSALAVGSLLLRFGLDPLRAGRGPPRAPAG